jgi:hypothetical protein
MIQEISGIVRKPGSANKRPNGRFIVKSKNGRELIQESEPGVWGAKPTAVFGGG